MNASDISIFGSFHVCRLSVYVSIVVCRLRCTYIQMISCTLDGILVTLDGRPTLLIYGRFLGEIFGNFAMWGQQFIFRVVGFTQGDIEPMWGQIERNIRNYSLHRVDLWWPCLISEYVCQPSWKEVIAKNHKNVCHNCFNIVTGNKNQTSVSLSQSSTWTCWPFCMAVITKNHKKWLPFDIETCNKTWTPLSLGQSWLVTQTGTTVALKMHPVTSLPKGMPVAYNRHTSYPQP